MDIFKGINVNCKLKLVSLTFLLLIGCRGEMDSVTFPPVAQEQPATPGEGPDGVIIPGLESTPDNSTGDGEGPDPVPFPTMLRGSISAGSLPVLGDVTCVGQQLDEFGQFSYRLGETITCDFGAVQLLNISTTRIQLRSATLAYAA
ncbi:hypothetical protein [Aeromonas sp. 102P]|uniref:hypothetical protein n=1 Tax=Aeromonas sp. 102P TaxID=3452711 RepID=UPI003F79762E